MNFLKVAKRDISSIFKNRFMRVSVIAIIIVPLLYSLLYLYAFWNPYSRLSDMPVAVVNLDKGTTKDGANVSYGKGIVDKLKGSSTVGWRFPTNLDEAKKGLEGTEYYAMIVIPEDFSSKILSAKDRKPEQPIILYSANEKKNFLAAQINGKIFGELRAGITKTISKEYTKATFDSLYDVKDGMQKATDGSKKLEDGITTLNSKIPELSDGVSKLNDGADKLNLGLGDAKNGGIALNGGIGQLSDKIPAMGKGVSDLYKGSSALATGADQLAKGLNDASGGATLLNNGAQGLNTAVTMKDGLRDGSDMLNNGALGLKAGADKLNAGYQSFGAGVNGLKVGTQQISDGVNELIGNVNASQAALSNAVKTQLEAYIAKHPEAMTDPDMKNFVGTLGSLQKSAGDPINSAKIGTLQKGAKDVSDGAATLESKSKELVQGLGGFSTGAQDFATGANKFATGAGQYSVGATQFSGGANKLATGLDAAIIGSKGLSDGAKQLNGGLGQLNGNIPALTGGVSKLNSGSMALVNGLGKLYDGSTQLKDGTSTLKGKIPELADGTSKLEDGSKELNDKLAEGSTKINKSLVNDSKTMAEFVSEPIIVDEKPVHAVSTYGAGFAPYFLALSLWIGALMMFFVITDEVDADINASPAAIVLGKFLSYGYIGIVQAVLASGIVMVLGLRPVNVPLYFGLNILMSLVSIAIIQCLVFLLGQVGRILSIILLLLQLTACAGTFPLELVPTFFKVLNPLMPFTYYTLGLREAIAGVDYSVFSKNSTVLVMVMVCFIVISVLLKGHADKLQKMIKDRKEEAATA